ESDDTHSLLRLAFGLLYSKRPALGIALARGVVPLLAASDAAQVMEALLRARDQLNLAPDDAISDVLEELSIYEAEAEDATEAYRDVQEKYEAQRRETRELREELERSRKKMKRLEEDRPRAAATGAATVVQASSDKSRQERKIIYLEEQLRASRGAEDGLRRDMQQIHLENQQLKQQASAGLTGFADPEGDREEELLLQTEALGAQPVRIIDFARDFQQRLSHAPRHVAVRAMTTLGEVAAGQPAAF